MGHRSELGPGSVLIAPGVVRGEASPVTLAKTHVIATYFDKQTSEDLQLNYDDGGKLTGVFGAYYFKGKAGGLVKNIFLNRIFGTTEGETNTDSIALFGGGSYQLNPKLRLSLGLRATREKKNGIALNRGFTNDTFTVVNAVKSNYDKTETFNSLAPKLGLDYQVNPNVLPYVTLSRGFKSGGFNVRAHSVSWLRLVGNVSYLSAKPDEFLDANHDHFVDTQVITNAPEFTGALHANLSFPISKGLITGSVGVSYRDDSVLTNEGGPYPGRPGQPLLPIIQPSFSLWDASIGWLSPNAKWRFGINGKNLADKGYVTNGYNIPALGILVGSYGAPRTVLATIDYKFF